MAAVSDASELEPMNQALARDAHATSSVDYLKAVMRLQRYVRRVVAFWSDVDVVVTPTLALPPVPIGWAWESGDPFDRFLDFTPFTPVVNLTGQPALSVPLAEHDGLPIGVQAIGPPFGEALLVRLASQLEEARPWIERRPPVFAA
jgi:amidase